MSKPRIARAASAIVLLGLSPVVAVPAPEAEQTLLERIAQRLAGSAETGAPARWETLDGLTDVKWATAAAVQRGGRWERAGTARATGAELWVSMAGPREGPAEAWVQGDQMFALPVPPGFVGLGARCPPDPHTLSTVDAEAYAKEVGNGRRLFLVDEMRSGRGTTTRTVAMAVAPEPLAMTCSTIGEAARRGGAPVAATPAPPGGAAPAQGALAAKGGATPKAADPAADVRKAVDGLKSLFGKKK